MKKYNQERYINKKQQAKQSDVNKVISEFEWQRYINKKQQENNLDNERFAKIISVDQYTLVCWKYGKFAPFFLKQWIVRLKIWLIKKPPKESIGG